MIVCFVFLTDCVKAKNICTLLKLTNNIAVQGTKVELFISLNYNQYLQL